MQDDRAVGTGIGLLAGAVGVVFLGTDNAEWWPLVLAGGAAIGYVVGDVIASRREKMIADREFVEAELRETDEALASLRDRNVALASAIQDLDGRVQGLELAKSGSAATSADRAETLDLIERSIAANETKSQRVRDAISYLETMRGETRVLSGDEVAGLDRKIEDMRAELAKLDRATTELADLRSRATAL